MEQNDQRPTDLVNKIFTPVQFFYYKESFSSVYTERALNTRRYRFDDGIYFESRVTERMLPWGIPIS